MIQSVSSVKGTAGILNSGRPPAMLATSPTVRVSRPNQTAPKLTTTMAAKADGIALVNFGKK